MRVTLLPLCLVLGLGGCQMPPPASCYVGHVHRDFYRGALQLAGGSARSVDSLVLAADPREVAREGGVEQEDAEPQQAEPQPDRPLLADA